MSSIQNEYKSLSEEKPNVSAQLPLTLGLIDLKALELLCLQNNFSCSLLLERKFLAGALTSGKALSLNI